MTTGRAALVCQQSHVHNPNKPNSSPRQRSHDQLPLVPSEPPDSQDLPSIHIRIDQQPGTEIDPPFGRSRPRCIRPGSATAINPAGNVLALRDGAVVVTESRRSPPISRIVIPQPTSPRHSTFPSESACLPQRCRGQRPSVSAGHVKKPDLLLMRPVEHTDRLGGGLQ
jgi:hypothetical protein